MTMGLIEKSELSNTTRKDAEKKKSNKDRVNQERECLRMRRELKRTGDIKSCMTPSNQLRLGDHLVRQTWHTFVHLVLD